MKKDPIKIVLILFLILGVSGTLFSFVLFIIGGKADGVISHVQYNTKNTVISIDYSYDDRTFTKSQSYQKNKKISKGETKKVYFFKNKPEKAYTMKSFSLFYFIVIFFTPFAYLLFKSKLPDERAAEHPHHSNKNKNDIES